MGSLVHARPVLWIQSLRQGFWCGRFIKEEACEGRKKREDVVQGCLAQTTPLSCAFLRLRQTFEPLSVIGWAAPLEWGWGT